MSTYQNFITRSLILAVTGIVVFCISGCRSRLERQSSDADTLLKGNISISGAFALYPLTVTWAENFKARHPNVNIDISAGGAGKGMVDVLSGMVDLAMFSREVTPEEEAKGAWKIAVAKDAVFPTINASNTTLTELKSKGLTREQFKSIFTSSGELTWNSFSGITSGEKINVYTRSDACGAAAMWASFFGRQQEDLAGIGVFGDPGIADAVKKDKFGVGYNNLIYIYDIKTDLVNEGLAIIPIDLNGDRQITSDENFYETMQEAREAIKAGKYPSPPARSLYLIAKGKPENRLIMEFLNYILNNGQELISRAGYIEQDENSLHKQKERLKKP